MKATWCLAALAAGAGSSFGRTDHRTSLVLCTVDLLCRSSIDLCDCIYSDQHHLNGLDLAGEYVVPERESYSPEASGHHLLYGWKCLYPLRQRPGSLPSVGTGRWSALCGCCHALRSVHHGAEPFGTTGLLDGGPLWDDRRLHFAVRSASGLYLAIWSYWEDDARNLGWFQEDFLMDDLLIYFSHGKMGHLNHLNLKGLF